MRAVEQVGGMPKVSLKDLSPCLLPFGNPIGGHPSIALEAKDLIESLNLPIASLVACLWKVEDITTHMELC